MPRLTVAMTVHNEAGRFLRPVLEAVRPWADNLVILEEASTDDSAAICREFADVFEHSDTSLFGEEWRLRSKLWSMAVATGAEWIGVLDADEWFEPCIADELDAAMESGARVLGYRRYDLWNDLQHYRDDDLWNAHSRLTPFAVRYDPSLPQTWPRKNQHVGNFPAHWNMQVPVYALRARMAHLGWVRPEDQRAKHARYLRLDPNPDARGVVHYASILDPAPKLSEWGGAPVFTSAHPRPRVEVRQPLTVVASPVRQTPKVLRAFLDGLDRLDACGQRIRYAFIDDCDDPKSSKILLDWAEGRPSEVYRMEGATSPNSYHRGENHNWTTAATTRLGEIRTHLLGLAVQRAADHLLLVDSDVVLRPDTLRWLLAADKPVVCEAMWTRYFPYQTHTHPNCWAWGDSNFWDGYAGEQMEPLTQFERWEAWRKRLRQPGVHQVGGLGAVTLIAKQPLQDIYLRGGYRPIPGSGSFGEDRWFCTRAAVLGYSLWADTHAEPLHLYRDSDLRKVPAFWRRWTTAAQGGHAGCDTLASVGVR